MHWKFKPLFTIHLAHNQWPVQGVRPMPTLFRLVPNEETKRLMQHYRWVFKPIDNGAAIFSEQIVSSNGEVQTPVPLKETTALTFYVHLLDRTMLNNTQPYMTRQSESEKALPVEFPMLSGRSRLFYFDNLNANNQPEDTQLSEQEQVSLADLASVLPLNAQLKAPSSRTQLVELSGIGPQLEPSAIYRFTAAQRSVALDVPKGVYRLKPDGGGMEETLLIDDTLAAQPPFAVIRLFQKPLQAADNTVRYMLQFAKA